MSIEQYIEACLTFAKATQEFRGLNEFCFYSTCENGDKKYGGHVVRTSQNPHGGLDVSWAFHQSPEYITEHASDMLAERLKAQK